MKIWIFRKYKILFWYISIPCRRVLPTNWCQITLQQAKWFGHCLIKCKQPFDQPFTSEFIFMVIRGWLDITLDEFYKLTDHQICTLIDRMDTLFSPPYQGRSDVSGDTEGVLVGALPAPRLSGETVEAFAIYETYYRQIISGEASALLKFASYIYRSPDKAVDDQLARETAKKIENEIYLQFFIYWWYYHTRQQLAEQYPGAFGKAGNSRKGPDFTSGHGWWGLIHSVAQDGPFHDEATLKQTELHDFLDYLEYQSKRMKELEWTSH